MGTATLPLIGTQAVSESLTTRFFRLPAPAGSVNLLQTLGMEITKRLETGVYPTRVAVTESYGGVWCCEVDVHAGGTGPGSLFQYKQRIVEDTSSFNAVLLVPTGIGAEIGGHAGDAGPVAALLANSCDSLITHPNVLNASDLIHIPENVLYVEGSVIAGMLMGHFRVTPVFSNRLLVIVQSHKDRIFTDAAINSVNAARAYFGLNATEVVEVGPDFKMRGEYSHSGSARGSVLGIERIWEILDTRLGDFDAVALSSTIDIPYELHSDYYSQKGGLTNPWGGVEAMLTHAISLKYGVPAAHSPMFESKEVADIDVGIVDPRMAAEVISLTFLQSVLRGLQRSPRITSRETAGARSLGVEEISCLVIPDGCIGLPTLAALYQGIRVIAVEENANLMRNDLSQLPWRDGQFIRVGNYWEAAGVISALKAGLDPYVVRRPISPIRVSTAYADSGISSTKLSSVRSSDAR